MDLKKFAINVWGVVFFIMIGLHCSPIYSAENMPPGRVLPDFELKGICLGGRG